LPTLDEILEPLIDGKWHGLEEINEAVRLPKRKFEEIIGFFAEYRFVKLDKENRRVKLTPSVLAFFAKFQQINQES
jgi:DNA-binding IclR family transcriptional regulator